MPSPFPGMDPYLEDPHSWPGVHLLLIATYAELLNTQLRPRYVAGIEERVYLVADDDPGREQERVPDLWIERRNSGKAKPRKQHTNGGVAVAEPLVVTTLRNEERHERRVEIRTTGTRELVTVIELLSPSNKVPGAEGRKSFLAKQREVTSSDAHWVEIDLLRHGASLDFRPRLAPHEYFVHVSPVGLRPKGRVWPIRLQGPLPAIGIPLRDPDPDASLDLQRALDMVYDRGAYDLKLDYTRPPVPPLPPALAKWADKLLKQQKLR
jgi:hypothetical protein